jgi:peroxiredoxin
MFRSDSTVNPLILVACCILLVVCTLSCSSEKNKRIKIGDPITPFTAEDITGKPIALDDYKGSPVILRFFLVDCKFCTADTPAFNAYFEKHQPNGLKIVYINNNAPNVEAVQEFAEKLAIRFPVIADPEARIAAQYNIKAQPLTLMLDPEHRLLAALLGGVSEDELADVMEPHLLTKK